MTISRRASLDYISAQLESLTYPSADPEAQDYHVSQRGQRVAYNIYRRPLRIGNMNELLDDYLDPQGRVHYWRIRRQSTEVATSIQEPWIAVREEVYLQTQIFIDFYFGVYFDESTFAEDVESELDSMETFDTICDLVIDHFKDDRSLGSTVWSVIRPISLINQLEEVGPGGVYVHRATFSVVTLDPVTGLAPS